MSNVMRQLAAVGMVILVITMSLPLHLWHHHDEHTYCSHHQTDAVPEKHEIPDNNAFENLGHLKHACEWCATWTGENLIFLQSSIDKLGSRAVLSSLSHSSDYTDPVAIRTHDRTNGRAPPTIC